MVLYHILTVLYRSLLMVLYRSALGVVDSQVHAWLCADIAL